MYADALIRPIQVRFVAPDDIEAYGDDWHTYDEAAILALPARELILLEKEMDTPLIDVMNGVRKNSIFGDTCSAWLALKAGGHAVTFADFNPAIALAEWRAAPVVPGKDPVSSPAPMPSGDPDIVLLPTMPAMESSPS